MRAPGLTWFRLPLFVWAHYATSVIQVLGTPVVAVTILMVALERIFHLGFFDPAQGGDPLLYQHLFWFYSHPAVYIMILPAMGVMSELVACFSRKRIFGYEFVAMSSMAIAIFGFLVWAHHMFVTGMSVYSAMIFSALTMLVALPSAVKVFNWLATLYKGSISWETPMLFAFGFFGLFLIGGLTGLFLGTLGTDVHLTDTYFIVAHFHYIMVGGHDHGVHGRAALLVAQDHGAHVLRVVVADLRRPDLRGIPPHVLPPVHPRLPRHATPVPLLRRRVPRAERDEHGGRRGARLWLPAAGVLLPLVAEGPGHGTQQSVGRQGSRVGDVLTAADLELRRRRPS